MARNLLKIQPRFVHLRIRKRNAIYVFLYRTFSFFFFQRERVK